MFTYFSISGPAFFLFVNTYGSSSVPVPCTSPTSVYPGTVTSSTVYSTPSRHGRTSDSTALPSLSVIVQTGVSLSAPYTFTVTSVTSFGHVAILPFSSCHVFFAQTVVVFGSTVTVLESSSCLPLSPTLSS